MKESQSKAHYLIYGKLVRRCVDEKAHEIVNTFAIAQELVFGM